MAMRLNIPAMVRTMLRGLTLAAAFMGLACRGDTAATIPTGPGSPPPPSHNPPSDTAVAEIVIFLPPTTIGVGETAILQSWANAARVGRIRPSTPIAWSGTSDGAATLTPMEADDDGVDFWATLHGVKKGTITAHATSGNKSSAAVITVGEPAASLSLAPASVTLNATVCEGTQLVLSLYDANGRALDGRKPIWKTSGANVGLLNGLGDAPNTIWVTGVQSGTAVVTATTGLISASTTVTVTGHWTRRSCED